MGAPRKFCDDCRASRPTELRAAANLRRRMAGLEAALRPLVVKIVREVLAELELRP